MKNIRIFFCVVLYLLFSSIFAKAQNDLCGLRNTSFQEGEKIYYNAYYNMSFIWVHAGEASFTIDKTSYANKEVYHITGVGKTMKSYEWFYKVTDRYETYIDSKTMLPYRFLRDVSEGDTKFKQDVRFNHAGGTALSKNISYNIPNCTQDVLSAIYYARNIDYSQYKPGDKIPFVMFLDDKVYNLYVRYIAKEKIKTKYGKFNAIKISPLLIEGTIFSGGEKMTVWISDDENHLPLRIESPIVIGSVKVDMMKYEGLRHPLSSQIKEK